MGLEKADRLKEQERKRMTGMNRQNSMIRKFRCRAAFTLAEMLVAILIMLMVSGIVAAGIPSAQRAYEGTVTASNAEILLSTTISALKGKLSIASSVEQVSETEISFYNPDTHSDSRIYLNTGGNGSSVGDIMFQGIVSSDGEPLVPSKAREEGQYPSYTSVTVDGKVVTFHGLCVKDADGKEIASTKTSTSGSSGNGDISFRILSESKQ